jgi:hypothetical protein
MDFPRDNYIRHVLSYSLSSIDSENLLVRPENETAAANVD